MNAVQKMKGLTPVDVVPVAGGGTLLVTPEVLAGMTGGGNGYDGEVP